MIHVIAVITAKPGKREAILQAFRANVPAVQAEKGCLEYGAAVDAELDRLVGDLAATPPDVVARVRAILEASAR